MPPRDALRTRFECRSAVQPPVSFSNRNQFGRIAVLTLGLAERRVAMTGALACQSRASSWCGWRAAIALRSCSSIPRPYRERVGWNGNQREVLRGESPVRASVSDVSAGQRVGRFRAHNPKVIGQAPSAQSGRFGQVHPPDVHGRDGFLTRPTLHEGPSVQIMYLGPYAEEGPTISRLHPLATDGGCRLAGTHHEIYFSDPRRAALEKLRTPLETIPARRDSGTQEQINDFLLTTFTRIEYDSRKRLR